MKRILACLCVLLAVPTAQAANLQDLIRDTQRNATVNGNLTMVWWMPQQFWEESMNANPSLPAAARQQVLSVLADYTIIAMMRATPDLTGLGDIQPKEELLKNTRVEFNGKLVEPVAPELIAPAAQLLLAQLKPAMAGLAGQVGQGLEFVVYPAKTEGKPLIDAGQTGSLQVTLYEQVFKWRLPLGSLLPVRIDKKTGEEFPGNYLYNPYTGDKLREVR